MQISPTDRFLNKLSENLNELLKKVILLSIDIKTFDFKFFSQDFNINPNLLNIITANFDSRVEAIEAIKSLPEKESEYSYDDKVVISLYLRYYNPSDTGENLIKTLLENNNPEELKLFTGKTKLSKKDREKLKSITLEELLKNGL